MTQEQILEILDSYKLRIPPTVFYDLKADIVNYEEQEPTTKNDLGVDCISRESVLKLIYDYKENHSNDREHYPINYGTLLDMCRWVRKLPSVTSQPRWIPVSERLPEANRAVLTYVDTGAAKTYCLADWNDVCEAWEEWIGIRMIEEEMGYKVLAWMPLPQPYREAEK